MAIPNHFLKLIKIIFQIKIELVIEWETHEPKYGVHTIIFLFNDQSNFKNITTSFKLNKVYIGFKILIKKCRREWMMVVKALPQRTYANCICIPTSSPRPKILPQIYLFIFFNLSSFSYLLNLIIYKHFKYKINTWLWTLHFGSMRFPLEWRARFLFWKVI